MSKAILFGASVASLWVVRWEKPATWHKVSVAHFAQVAEELAALQHEDERMSRSQAQDEKAGTPATPVSYMAKIASLRLEMQVRECVFVRVKNEGKGGGVRSDAGRWTSTFGLGPKVVSWLQDTFFVPALHPIVSHFDPKIFIQRKQCNTHFSAFSHVHTASCDMTKAIRAHGF